MDPTRACTCHAFHTQASSASHFISSLQPLFCGCRVHNTLTIRRVYVQTDVLRLGPFIVFAGVSLRVSQMPVAVHHDGLPGMETTGRRQSMSWGSWIAVAIMVSQAVKETLDE